MPLIKRSGSCALSLLFGLFSAAVVADSIGISQDTLRDTAENFYRLELDPGHVYPITTATLQRDRLKIDLEGGVLVLSHPLLDRITGACYVGKAHLSLTPPTPFERAALEDHLGEPPLEADVKNLYLRFYDHTVSDLTEELEPGENSKAFKQCSKIFTQRNRVVRTYEEDLIGLPFNLELDFIEDVLSPAMQHDFFLLETELDGRGWITYIQRPRRDPQVALLQIQSPGYFGNLLDSDAWTYYSLEDERVARLTEIPSADILHNEMQITIPDRAHFTIDALITWKATTDVRSARFALVNTLGGSTWDDDQAKRVDLLSVTSEDGNRVPYVHHRHEVLVALPTRLNAGEISTLRFEADEKTIFQITPESYWVLNTYPWFPHETNYLGGTYTIDWSVQVRRPMLAIGSGTTVRTWVDKKHGFNGAQWKSDVPLTFPSLLFGNYELTQETYQRREDGGTVNINLHWMPKVMLEQELQPRTYGFYNAPVESGGPKIFTYTIPMGKPRALIKEVARILDYFEQILGPYPNDEIDLAQMAPYMWFGQAPPGLVQITGEYFLSQGLISSVYQDPGAMDFLRNVLPHEIAHHYWGDVVSWKSPADQWLSESLAEYSAALFMQAAEGENVFRQIMNHWRQTCEHWEGSTPIAQAHRTSGNTRWAVRNALLYNKGPLVLHMLRKLVGDEDFGRILKKLLTDYRGQAISTADIEAVSETVVGASMDWFFNQWIRSAGIPELRFTYDLTPRDGKILFTGRLEQADPSNPKALFVPLKLQFPGDRQSELQWLVTDADESIELMLPEEPLEVLLDESRDLLVKFRYD